MRTSVGGNAQLCLIMCSRYSITTKCFKVLYLSLYAISSMKSQLSLVRMHHVCTTYSSIHLFISMNGHKI